MNSKIPSRPSVVAAMILKRLLIFFIYCSNLLEKRSFLLSKNLILITFTDSKIAETFLLSGTLFNQLDDDDDDDDNNDDDKMKEKSKFLKRT